MFNFTTYNPFKPVLRMFQLYTAKRGAFSALLKDRSFEDLTGADRELCLVLSAELEVMDSIAEFFGVGDEIIQMSRSGATPVESYKLTEKLSEINKVYNDLIEKSETIQKHISYLSTGNEEMEAYAASSDSEQAA